MGEEGRGGAFVPPLPLETSYPPCKHATPSFRSTAGHTGTISYYHPICPVYDFYIFYWQQDILQISHPLSKKTSITIIFEQPVQIYMDRLRKIAFDTAVKT